MNLYVRCRDGSMVLEDEDGKPVPLRRVGAKTKDGRIGPFVVTKDGMPDVVGYKDALEILGVKSPNIDRVVGVSALPSRRMSYGRLWMREDVVALAKRRANAAKAKGRPSMDYAPVNDEGLKPWHVTVTAEGKTYEQIIYAKKAPAAAYRAKKRHENTTARVRRATVADVERTAKQG